MKSAITNIAAAGLALVAAGVSPASAFDAKTWYVYCEGSNRRGEHWAVFSENLWSHPLTAGYGREVATKAQAIFESRHDVQLDGCVGVNFVDSSLAEHSRSRTAQLHEKMGDRVLYFRVPDEALPAEHGVEAPVTSSLREVIDAVPERDAKVAEPHATFKLRVPER